MYKVKIAPSILSADFSRLAEEVKRVEEAGADMVHIDVMDGHFVPNMTVGPVVVRCLRDKTRLPFDVHLMVERPELWVDKFIEAGADIVTVHVEATRCLYRLLSHIKDRGVKAGVALNPQTPPSQVSYVLDKADMVLVMTVDPGFGGQKFIAGMLRKIERVRKLAEEAGLNLDVEVDGGINHETARLVVKAGANVLVAGAYVFEGGNPIEAIKRLRESALQALSLIHI